MTVWPRCRWCFHAVFLLIAAKCAWTQESHFGGKCHIRTERIGCFKDPVIPSRPIPVLLFTDRDPTSPVYTGGFVDLKNWNLYMDDLKCRCAEEALGKGYRIFGLQWYGECWSGPNAHETYNISGPSDKCVTHDLAHCTDEKEECVGRDFVNFVYEIVAANISNNATGKHIHIHTMKYNETKIITGYNNTHIHHSVMLTTPAPTTSAPKPSPEPTIPPPPSISSHAPVYVPCQSGCLPPLICPTTYSCTSSPVYSDDKTNPQMIMKRKKTRLLERILKQSTQLDSPARQVVTFLVGSLKRGGDIVKDTRKKMIGH